MSTELKENEVKIGDRTFTLSPVKLSALRKGTFVEDFRRIVEFSNSPEQLPNAGDLTAFFNIMCASCCDPDFATALDGVDGMQGVRMMTAKIPLIMKLSGFGRATNAEDGKKEGEE